VKDYVLTLLVAAAVTYILTPLVRRLAGRIGAVKQPRARDVHVVPVPTIGGLAMYGGLAAGLLVADHISVLRVGLANTGMITGLLLAGGLLLVIGFIDDRWGMDALPKAAGQVAAGGILVATGTSLSWLPLPGGNTYVPTTDQATLLTILVVVATINAVNFIDGLDGLAAGIVCIAAVSFFLYYYVLTKVTGIDSLAAPALASAILIGMCLGFLPHNFSPATIFMGDTGSMLLGLLLAYAPISSITSVPQANLTSQINRYPVVLPLLLPAALLVIPYGDMLLAVVRRTRAGRSPFAPDRKHLHHRLLDIGHSQRASVLIMYLWAAAFSGTVVWLSIQKTVQHGNSNHHGAPIFVFVIITALAFAVLLLLSMPRLRWWQRTRRTGAAGAGVVGAGTANGRGTGPALESPGLGSPVPGSPILESPVPGSSLPGSPLPGSAGPGGSRLAGMTAGPTVSRDGSAGQTPGRGGRLGRASAEPAAGTPPFAAPPFAAPPFAAPPSAADSLLAAPPFAAPPFAAPPSVVAPVSEAPLAGSPFAGAPSAADPLLAAPPFAGAPSAADPLLAAPPFAGSPSAADPLLAAPPFAAPPFAAPPSAGPALPGSLPDTHPSPATPMPAPVLPESPIAGLAPSQPQSSQPPSSQPPLSGRPEAGRSSADRGSPEPGRSSAGGASTEPGSRAPGQDWATRQPARRRDQPASSAGRSSWHADRATPNVTEPARSLAFWRNPATGLPPTGLPAAGRSVIGTPPPAVSGPHGLPGATRRASTWRSEALPPAAADGNTTEPDGLP